MTTFIVEHQCPQCGAPAELAESDRFFHCGFCRTSSYLTTTGFFRYMLPHCAPPGEQLIYFPFWRLKGMLFSCLTRQMQKRFVDVSQQAVPTARFPVSLGFRSQTQKLRFAVGDDADAIFIKPQVSIKELPALVSERFSANLPKPILYQEFIGETTSLIYAPYYFKGRLMDAILNEPVPTDSSDDLAPILGDAEPPHWPLTFIPALCPQCGWDLEGQRDALALVCDNCQRVWRARQGGLQDIQAVHLPDDVDGVIYMPFWRIKADTGPVKLTSYADLVKTANLPKAPQPGWESIPFYFWSPAFKVRPQNFLTLASAVTIAQPRGKLCAGRPPGSSHAVNLPLAEAVESLKLNLSNIMRPRERMVEQLPQVTIKARSFQLVYLPFREEHHELVHHGMRLAISKNMLEHAKNL